MKRELENATARLFIAKKINPKQDSVPDLKFKDCLPYLKLQHPRWKKLRAEDINTGEQRAMKTLCSLFHNIKKNPSSMEPLMNEFQHGSTDSENESSDSISESDNDSKSVEVATE